MSCEGGGSVSCRGATGTGANSFLKLGGSNWIRAERDFLRPPSSYP